MNFIKAVFASRLFWTGVIAFIINVKSIIPVTYMPLVDGVLGVVMVYFHLNPSVSTQNYIASKGK